MSRCSIVMPAYNKASLTRQCVNALLSRHTDDESAEIIVVDDHSTDATPQVLAGYGEAIRVVTHETNQGFATSCNDGAASAKGEYLVFLNNDTMPQPGWLTALVRYADAHPRCAVVGSKLLFPDRTIQHAGVVICQDGTPRHLYTGFPCDHPAVNRPRQFQIVTAACALVRRAAFEWAGGFDAAFRNGFEDVDLCLRLREHGHEIHYCPESVLYHLESVSREGQSGNERQNYKLYRRRWADRVRPDDLEYYLEDGLLRLDYDVSYPVQLSVSPLLAVLPGEQREHGCDRLLKDRSRQVAGLLKEVIRLNVRLQEGDRASTVDPGKSSRAALCAPSEPRLPIESGTPGPLPALSSRERELREMLLDTQEELLTRDEEILGTLAVRLEGGEGANEQGVGAYLEYRHLVWRIREAVIGVVPPDATVLIASRGDDDLLKLGVKKVWHFPRDPGGRYAGYHPHDSAQAIAHLEELRRHGAEYLVLPWTMVWWLQHYRAFAEHLEQRYSLLLRRDEVCLIYGLGKASLDTATPSPVEHTAGYQQVIQRVRQVVHAKLPAAANVLVVSRGDADLLELEGRSAAHFPQGKHGTYAGHHPSDSEEAIAQLEALRAKGAGYLLFPSTAFWWLDYYRELAHYLKSRYRKVWSNDDCEIYDLAGFLRARIETELPRNFVVGKGNVLYLNGWCYHTASSIDRLEIVADGVPHPITAFSIPRRDVWEKYAPPHDPEGHAYHSGFWALIPFHEVQRDAAVELVIRATLPDGAVCQQPLATIQITPAPPPVADRLPTIRGGSNPASMVGICMTTYNPPLDLFCRQIRSIQAQTYPHWICVISDDGSAPDRIERMREIIGGDNRFFLYPASATLGVYRNVERSLSLLPPGVDIVAPADQDDYWYPEKLETLVGRLDSGVTLVYSDMSIVDANGRVRSATYWTTRRNNHTNLVSLLLANTVTGAASIFRRSLLEHLLPFPDKLGDSYHDHWIACTALALGEVRYVDRPLYDYVQHASNVIGHYAPRQAPLAQLIGLRQWLRPVRSTDEWDRLLSEGRSIYHAHVLRICQFARVLEMRGGDRLSRRKRNAVRHMAAIDTAGGAVWLFFRGQREMLRTRSVTLGAELRLLQGIMWRRKLTSMKAPLPAGESKSPPTRSAKSQVVPEITRLEQVAFLTKKVAPLRLRVKRIRRRVNLLVGIIDFKYVFGGYLTVFHLARRLCEQGLKVRLVIVDQCDFQPEIWREQFRAYAGLEDFLDLVEVVYAHDRNVPLEVSADDAFMATSWWTAHVAHQAVTTLKKSRFVYLSQDYEPMFYPMGPLAALANESYSLPHYAVFSTELLRDYFRQNALGVFAAGEEAGDRESISFRNAITPVEPVTAEEMARRRVRKLLFYARPETHATRNLFEIGVLGLCRAIEDGCFDESWEFYGIGTLGSSTRTKLTAGRILELVPRMSVREYASVLRGHDVGLSLMYSPHPSLVPIEMASAGMLTVTNRFLNKTADQLHAISSNFVVTDATVDGVKRGLHDAVRRVDQYDQRVAGARVDWSRSWDEAFNDGITKRIVDFLATSSANGGLGD